MCVRALSRFSVSFVPLVRSLMLTPMPLMLSFTEMEATYRSWSYYEYLTTDLINYLADKGHLIGPFQRITLGRVLNKVISGKMDINQNSHHGTFNRSSHDQNESESEMFYLIHTNYSYKHCAHTKQWGYLTARKV